MEQQPKWSRVRLPTSEAKSLKIIKGFSYPTTLIRPANGASRGAFCHHVEMNLEYIMILNNAIPVRSISLPPSLQITPSYAPPASASQISNGSASSSLTNTSAPPSSRPKTSSNCGRNTAFKNPLSELL